FGDVLGGESAALVSDAQGDGVGQRGNGHANRGAVGGKLESVLGQLVHDFTEIVFGNGHRLVGNVEDQIVRAASQVGLFAGVFLDEFGRAGGLFLAQGIDLLGVGAEEFEFGVNEKVLDQPLQALAGVTNDLAHLGDFAGGKGGRVSGEHFAIGQDAVVRGAQLVREHEADVVAQIGEFLLGFLADG